MVSTSSQMANKGKRSVYQWLIPLYLLCGLAAVAGFVRVSYSPITKEELMVELAGSSVSVSAPPWSSRRGRAPARLAPRDSFRLGVWTLELGMAAERNDEKTFQLKARDIRQILADTKAPELRLLMEEISSSKNAQWRDQARFLDDLLAESTWLLDESYFALGKWSITSWRILEHRRFDLIPGLLRDWNYPGIQGKALESKVAVADLIRQQDFDRAQAALRNLIEESGQLADGEVN